MQRNNAAHGLDYHPKCEKIKLFHLIFADDVFVVSGATKKAMQLVKKTLHEFENLSGLNLNLQKCNVFLVGAYISTRITCTNCIFILEKMNSKI